jgi:hypothetical protein
MVKHNGQNESSNDQDQDQDATLCSHLFVANVQRQEYHSSSPATYVVKILSLFHFLHLSSFFQPNPWVEFAPKESLAAGSTTSRVCWKQISACLARILPTNLFIIFKIIKTFGEASAISCTLLIWWQVHRLPAGLLPHRARGPSMILNQVLPDRKEQGK